MPSTHKESAPINKQAKTGTIEASDRVLSIRSGIDMFGKPDSINIMRRKRRKSRSRRVRSLLRPDSLNPIARGAIYPSSARKVA